MFMLSCKTLACGHLSTYNNTVSDVTQFSSGLGVICELKWQIKTINAIMIYADMKITPSTIAPIFVNYHIFYKIHYKMYDSIF